MSEFSKYYSGRDLQDLNIYRQFKNVIHLSCIVLSDGHTIGKECMNSKEGRSDLHKFPLQHPSRAAKNLWTTAIKRICLDYLVIPEALGRYIRPPHKNLKWTTNHEGTIAHSKVIINEMRRYIVFSLSSDRGTRWGQRMTRMDSLASYPLQCYASIIWVDDDTVILHSWVPEYQTPATTTSTFWQAIRMTATSPYGGH
jgi:hypothetical protein